VLSGDGLTLVAGDVDAKRVSSLHDAQQASMDFPADAGAGRPAGGPHARLRHSLGVNAGFALMYMVAVLAGRATRLEGSPLALIWPAAAVGFGWLAVNWDRRERLAVAVVLLSLVAGVGNALTGAGWALGSVLGMANGVQAFVACLVMYRLQVRTGSAPWRLRSPDDLTTLILAAVAGALVAAGIAPVALSLSAGTDLLPLAGAWVLRNAVSTYAFAAIAMRVGDRSLPDLLWPGRHGGAELAAATAMMVVAYTAVFGISVHLSLAFLLIPLSMWVSRFDTTIAAAHVLLVGVFVVLATMGGRGPFTLGPPSTRVLLAQAFVAVAGTVALVLALHRDERQVLVSDLRRVQRDSAEQAALLQAVFETITDGVAVYDGDGVPVLRNPAAARMFTGPVAVPPLRSGTGSYELAYPDGRPLPAHELPTARALWGETVTDFDVLVRTADAPEGRTLRMSAHPMPLSPGSTWSGGAVLAFQDVSAARAATAEIARARDLFSGVLAAATEQSIIGYDHDGRIMLFNHGAERMLGYSSAEMIGSTVDVLHEKSEVAARGAELGTAPGPDTVFAAAAQGRAQTSQWTYLTKDGRCLQVLLSVSALRDSQGRSIGSIGVATDITEQVIIQARLAESEQRFRVAFDTAPVGMMLVGLTGAQEGRILRVNQTLCDFTGRSEAALLALDVHALAHPEDRLESEQTFTQFLTGELHEARMEKRYQHADSSTRWGLLAATVSDVGDRQELLCLIEDTTARRHAEQALLHQALHDGLTGLANRALLRDRLAKALTASARSGQRVGLLYLDLDGFKGINDSAGHAAGDQVLQQVATRLSGCVRPGDTISRLGGDEFVVLCPEAGTVKNLALVADRVVAALALPVRLSVGTFSIGASIGLTVSTPASHAEQLLDEADEAMYAAKRAGKNQIMVHDKVAHARVARQPLA
jgi:diguanylate cyclase (GGDEF)-like protein/PAS domain S-box-containing protein